MISRRDRRLVRFCCLALPLFPATAAQAQAPLVQTYPFARPVFSQMFRVAAVEPGGTVRLEPLGPVPAAFSIAEGHYFLATPQSMPAIAPIRGSRQIDSLVRIEVSDVGEIHALTAKAGTDAAGLLQPGDAVMLFRPGGLTTSQIRNLPANLRGSLARADEAARLARSIHNLRAIGLAIHNFHTAKDSFPSAIIFGPDGKPWHSWRVLILPFLGINQLYTVARAASSSKVSPSGTSPTEPRIP